MTSPVPRFFVSATRCATRCASDRAGCAYRVAWSINPHMRVGAARGRRAARQHERLVAALAAAGAHVHRLPFVHGAYDSVFAKDNALVVERADGAVDALLAQPKHGERRREQAPRARALAAAGVRVRGDAPHVFEGGDVVVGPAREVVLLGHGHRSSPHAADAIARFVEAPVLPLELVDERLYHLDMAVAWLDDGTLLACREALAARSFRALERHPAVRDLVVVPHVEALRFGANLVAIGDVVLAAGDAPRTFAALEARGRRVVRLDLGELHLAGGSAACLVSAVHPYPQALAVADRSTAA